MKHVDKLLSVFANEQKTTLMDRYSRVWDLGGETAPIIAHLDDDQELLWEFDDDAEAAFGELIFRFDGRHEARTYAQQLENFLRENDQIIPEIVFAEPLRRTSLSAARWNDIRSWQRDDVTRVQILSGFLSDDPDRKETAVSLSVSFSRNHGHLDPRPSDESSCYSKAWADYDRDPREMHMPEVLAALRRIVADGRSAEINRSAVLSKVTSGKFSTDHLRTLLSIGATDTPDSLASSIRQTGCCDPEAQPWEDSLHTYYADVGELQESGETVGLSVVFDDSRLAVQAEVVSEHSSAKALRRAFKRTSKYLNRQCDACDPGDLPYTDDGFEHHHGEKWWMADSGAVQLFQATGTSPYNLVVRTYVAPVEAPSAPQALAAPSRAWPTGDSTPCV